MIRFLRALDNFELEEQREKDMKILKKERKLEMKQNRGRET